MIESFAKKWENRKHILKEYIETHNIEEFSSYGDLVKLVLQYVVNDEEK